MSILKVWEMVRGGSGLMLLNDRVKHQQVSFDDSAGVSEPFGSDISVISIISEVACAVKVSGDPVSDNNGYPVKANELTSFEVAPGSKISVIET